MMQIGIKIEEKACKKMDRDAILNRYQNEEERLFVSKILDKINQTKTRNQITNTDFLSMYEQKLSRKILESQKEENYIFYLPEENLEKAMLIIYPDKCEDIFINNRFDYSKLVSLIRITLPNELKGKYEHKDYLSGIMKLGIRREKVGDILVFEEGADVVCTREISNYILNNLQQLTRFSKAKIEELNINNIRKPEIKKEEKRITVSSIRIDNIVSELANCSRVEATKIIEEQRVMLNYERETRNSKIINEKDVIVIRGKGKFEIKEILGETKKGKIALVIEHYI